MNSPQLCSISQLDAGIGRSKWTHAYDIRREESMDMNSDLPDFQTGGESQEVIPDHHCPLQPLTDRKSISLCCSYSR